MRKRVLVLAALALSSMMSISAYAGEWKQDNTGWWYQNDDGSYPTNTWQEIDGKQYYFGNDGYMFHDTTTPDGYKVGSDGAWVENNVSIRYSTEDNALMYSIAAKAINALVKDALNPNSIIIKEIDYIKRDDSPYVYESWYIRATAMNQMGGYSPIYSMISHKFDGGYGELVASKDLILHDEEYISLDIATAINNYRSIYNDSHTTIGY